MTLYDTPAELLQQMAEAAAAGAGQMGSTPLGSDLRQVALISRRLAAMWPQLFTCLLRENEILSDTLEALKRRVGEAGEDPTGGHPVALEEDPLLRYQALLGELDRMSTFLAGHSSHSWAREARRVLRAGLGVAAEIQGRLVDDAFGA
jgi:hypothetical protein